MTKDEFLPTLSLKAQNIVKENLKVFHGKTFKVLYSNVSKVVSKDNDDYIIYVKNDIPNDIEYRFLHEFFHCVQSEIGYPTLISTDYKYNELATSIASMILDLDVRERLECNGYFQDLKYIKESIRISTKLLKMIQQFNNKEIMTSIDDIIGLVGIMLTTDIVNIKNDELFVLIKNTRPKVIKYYTIFSNCIELYSYNNAKEVNDIFVYLLDKLELSSFIKIKN